MDSLSNPPAKGKGKSIPSSESNSRFRSQSVGPHQRQNKPIEERNTRPISQTNSKQKLGVAFGSRASKTALQHPLMNNNHSNTTNNNNHAMKSIRKPMVGSDSRKSIGERVMMSEDASPVQGFARLQQMTHRVKQPVIIRHEDDDDVEETRIISQGVHGMGLGQSSRASELRGESEYLKFSGEQLNEDQLDKLMRKRR